MSAANADSNKCPLISLPLGAALLVLFFLPWLDITQDSLTIGKEERR